jgi:hypothetical protein
MPPRLVAASCRGEPKFRNDEGNEMNRSPEGRAPARPIFCPVSSGRKVWGTRRSASLRLFAKPVAGPEFEDLPEGEHAAGASFVGEVGGGGADAVAQPVFHGEMLVPA